MVRVIGYHESERSDGEKFYSLSIQGGVEMVRSAETGNYYATARKARITSTFDEATCKALIGSEMPGRIVKQECDPYEYTVEDTGEVIELHHHYRYLPDEMESQEAAILAD